MPALVFLLLVGCAGSEVGEEPAAAASASTDAGEGEGAEPKKEDEKKKKKKKKKERSTSVKVSAALRGDLVLPVVAEGTVRARKSADIPFELSGRITRIWVEEGQRVEKGDRLAALDGREYRLALEEAKSRYLKGLGQLAVEEESYQGGERAERLLEEQRAELARDERAGRLTRDQRLDRELELGMEAVRKGAYRRELLEVRSGLSAARADIARLELQLERTVLRAPFAGVVSELALTAGERVQPGRSLCRLTDDVELEAQVGVLEADLGFVQVGKPALLELPALATQVPATVDVVSPDVDVATRTCRVLLRISGADHTVKPGMFVRAVIAGRTFPDRLLVPAEAVVSRDGRPVVFRVEDKRAHWVYVTLGERNERVVEIENVLQGGPLEAGTPVVIDNHLTLTHEAKVKVKKTVPIADPWARPSDDS